MRKWLRKLRDRLYYKDETSKLEEIVLSVLNGINSVLWKIELIWKNPQKLNLKTGYKWVDKDYLVLIACFELLSRFVEEELGKSDDPEDSHRGYRLHFTTNHDKLIDLYLWYKEEYPTLEDRLNDELDLYTKEHGTSKEAYEKYDFYGACDKKLRELIDLRSSMWT